MLLALLAAAAGDLDLVMRLREQVGGSNTDTEWLTLFSRPVARGEVAAGAVHPRVASAPMPLRGAYALHSLPEVPDAVLTESVDEISCPWYAGVRTTPESERSGPGPGQVRIRRPATRSPRTSARSSQLAFRSTDMDARGARRNPDLTVYRERYVRP
ncbi:hypothetical protein [Streptomyces sp. NPDC048295]|uniref:hypothetical protein n=1 Tax=Streptomyces sp. NPDC048295 TaxID=3154617 RepID=UPI00342E98DA